MKAKALRLAGSLVTMRILLLLAFSAMWYREGR